MPFPAKPRLLGSKGVEARGKGMWYPQFSGPKSNQVLLHFSPFLGVLEEKGADTLLPSSGGSGGEGCGRT